MKHQQHQFKSKPRTESLNFTLLPRRGRSCSPTSTFPTFKASHQRGFSTRFLLLITYLLSSIGTIYGMCPSQCSCDDMYQSVKCEGLSQVPRNIPNNTRFLSITNGNISTLKGSDLFPFASLKMLSLENNQIEEISRDCFNKSKKLQKLDLNGNRLSAFPEAVTGLKRLTDLHLQDNDIANLTTSKPLVLQKLKFLNLESNRLTKVTRTFFNSMSKLSTLKMSFNLIEQIDDNWLIPLKNLKLLELENSFIKPPSIGKWFFREPLDSLNGLNLAYNGISSLPRRTFTYFPNLTFLILSNNNITELPSNISIRCLKQLDLGMNQIERLRPETFQGKNVLTTLCLTSNQIQSLPENTFQNLEDLEYLDLNYNYLSTIKMKTFASMTSLKKLLLSGNSLQVLHPQLLRNNRKLEVLDLGNNLLENLHPNFFNNMTFLNELRINDNQLVELPDVRNLEKLQFLDASRNQVMELAPDAFGGTSLETILVSYNYISIIYSETIDNLVHSNTLHTFNIDGNPIVCDCMIYWAYTLMNSPDIYVSNFTCFSPIRFENKGFRQIDRFDLLDYLKCSDEVDIAFIQKITIGWFSFVLVFVFVYWLKVYNKSLKLWRAWSPSKRKRKCEVSNKGKPNTYYRISNDNFWNNNNLFTHRMTSSFRRVRLTESLHSNEYLETIV